MFTFNDRKFRGQFSSPPTRKSPACYLVTHLLLFLNSEVNVEVGVLYLPVIFLATLKISPDTLSFLTLTERCCGAGISETSLARFGVFGRARRGWLCVFGCQKVAGSLLWLRFLVPTGLSVYFWPLHQYLLVLLYMWMCAHACMYV